MRDTLEGLRARVTQMALPAWTADVMRLGIAAGVVALAALVNSTLL